MADPVAHEYAPELVIALVGAVGSDLDSVEAALTDKFRAARYEVVHVRLSRLMRDLPAYAYLADKQYDGEDERIDTHMDAGNNLRDRSKRGDAIALLGVTAIQEERAQLRCDRNLKDNEVPSRVAYIIKSLKHPHEVQTLRKIYGPHLYVVSVYAPRHARKRSLQAFIARSRHTFYEDQFVDKAEYLVEKDEKEADNPMGQNVHDTFPEGDFFIEQRDDVLSQCNRFINLIFGHPYMTPTRDEYAMFHAFATARRSADLSRQVGAVITNSEGGIISVGCNEVPKPGGGSVWAEDVDDASDDQTFVLAKMPVRFMKNQIVTEIFKSIKDKKPEILSESYRKKNPGEICDEALRDKENPFLKETRAANIIEFGRIVHAEMSAITDAARRGLSIANSTLYCTTFPCHMCARHIISAGIMRVVYIEPYPKSMAQQPLQGCGPGR
ncbi:MAG: anti-phage dCTP deaminase [Rhodovibrio sp.]|nr:anti-phage dCTP deaminase [Rhodovibrio sp.]